MLVAVLFRSPVNNARLWFGVGGLGIQPSELAKLAAIFFTALILERRMHRIHEWRYALLPVGIVAGLLVGFGTRLGNGCTSGHGVCGMARLSPRSLAATATFMASAAATVFVLRHVIGG